MRLCLSVSYAFGGMGNGEWGMGRDATSRSSIPTPHSPLPIPHLSFDHSSDRLVATLADFSGDVRDQRAFFIGNLSAPQNAASNRRGDLTAISDQVSAAGLTLLIGQKIEQDANGSQRIFEESPRRFILEPV